MEWHMASVSENRTTRATRRRATVVELRRSALLGFAIAALGLATVARGAPGPPIKEWIDSAGGSFSDPNNWNPLGVPGSGDKALFNRSSSGYTVNITSNIANTALAVQNDRVTLDIFSSAVYTLSGGVDVGENADEVGTG